MIYISCLHTAPHRNPNDPHVSWRPDSAIIIQPPEALSSEFQILLQVRQSDSANARVKHPDIVLIDGGSPKGAEKITACWADTRGVPQIVFKPDWTRHGRTASFKRNDQMLEALPIGIITFPDSGMPANLADKARRMGIPVWRVDKGEGGA